MSAKSNDTLFLAIGGLAVVGAGIWAIVQQSHIEEFRAAPSVPSGGIAYEPGAITVSSPESRRWAPAPHQTAGPLWIYDVFTPPKIYYNTQTRQFTPIPPDGPPPPPKHEPEEVPFGLELVKVEQPLFRLQLVGYVGEGDQARGNFLNVETGAVVFGTTGRKLPDLDIEIVRFAAERRVVQQPGGTTLVFVEATAIVRDLKTGEEVKLDTQTRVPGGAPVVTLKDASGAEHKARAGETLTLGDFTYKVGELTLEPPSATVTKEGAGLPEPETKTLVVPPPPAPPPPTGVMVQEGFPGAFPGAFPGF